MRTVVDDLYDMICKALHIVCTKIIHAEMEFDTITDINEKWLNILKDEYGIQAIILDMDNTLREFPNEIPEYNMEWIKLLLKNFKVIILSNGLSPKYVRDSLENLQVKTICFAIKPAKIGFKVACKKMGVRPENVLVIGDDIINDIYGAHRNNMMAIKVNKAEKNMER